MMRVIQDSDDELEEDLETVVYPGNTNNASATKNANTDDTPAESGTGSTESLRRAFAEAHRDHLQTLPLASTSVLHNGPLSSLSLPEQGSDKGITATNNSSRKPLFAIETISEDFCPTAGIEEKLENRVPNDYIEHEPMALFPEPSSTVPNATMTQQRVLEGLAPPALFGLESDVDAPPCQVASDGSIQWSQFMDLSPADGAGERSTSSEHLPGMKSPARNLQMPQELQNHPPSQSGPKGSPSRKDVQSQESDILDLIRPSVEPFSSQNLSMTTTLSVVALNDAAAESQQKTRRQLSQARPHEDSEDDLATIGLPEEQYKPRPSRSRSLKTSGDNLIDHLVRVEKASRSSRRRKTAEQSNVNSTTPQKIQQICDMGFTPSTTEKALKQNNGDVTQTVEWLVHNCEGEDELASHAGPIKVSTPKVARASEPIDAVSLQTNGTQKWQQEQNNNMVEYQPDRSNHPLQTKNALANSDRPQLSTSTIAVQAKSPKVQVVIPTKSPENRSPQKRELAAGPDKKSKRRKTTSDIPAPESVSEVPSTSTPAVTKKRGRGRPKKTERAAISNGEEKPSPVEVAHEIDSSKLPEPSEPNTTTNEEAQNDPRPAMEALEQGQNGTDTENQTLHATATSSLKDESSPSHASKETLLKPSEPLIQKSRALYRVGLSKRARIAPLLRTLKK